MNYREIILQRGWVFTGSCRCGGVLKEKFERGPRGVEKLIVYPTRNRIVVKLLNQPTRQGTLANIETLI